MRLSHTRPVAAAMFDEPNLVSSAAHRRRLDRDMALLRHGAMGKLFDQPYAPSTLGSFLRSFTFGHVRQLDAAASRLLTGLAERTDLLPGLDGTVLIDVDHSIVEVHGHAKQGAGFGYTRVRGLHMLLATVSTEQAAPVVLRSVCARVRAPRPAARAGWSPMR